MIYSKPIFFLNMDIVSNHPSEFSFSSKIFCVGLLRFSTLTVITLQIMKTLFASPILMPIFLLFSYRIALAKNSDIMLNNRCERRRPCLVLSFFLEMPLQLTIKYKVCLQVLAVILTG